MADALDPEPIATPGAGPTPDVAPEVAPDVAPPMLPSRSAYLLAFGAVVLAGLFGAIIGYGVADGVEVRAVVPASEQGLEDFFLELTGTDDAVERAPRKKRAGLGRLLHGGRR